MNKTIIPNGKSLIDCLKEIEALEKKYDIDINKRSDHLMKKIVGFLFDVFKR